MEMEMEMEMARKWAKTRSTNSYEPLKFPVIEP
jgi:hypothetical protein